MCRIAVLCVLALVCGFPVVAGTGLAREDVRTEQVTLYDNYFNACRACLVAGVDGNGENVVMLGLTLEEGNISMDRDDEVSFRLVNGKTVTLQCEERPGRGDAHTLRFKNGNVRRVSVYFRISGEQLSLMMESDSRTFSVKNGRGELKRNLKDVKNKFSFLCKCLKDKGVQY